MIRVELKYCEACGGLILRPAGSDFPYCRLCAERLADLAPPPKPPRSATSAPLAGGVAC